MYDGNHKQHGRVAMQTTIQFLCNASKRMYVRQQGITSCMTVSQSNACIILEGDWSNFAQPQHWGHLVYSVSVK